MNLDKYYRGYALIDLDAVYHNVLSMKNNIDRTTEMVAVIKADGYGHGAVPIAETVAELVDAYAVATIDEAMNLIRHNIKKPIYVVGFTHISQYERAVEHDIRLTVFHYEMAKGISDIALRYNKIARIHIKIDTGMSRIGFADNDEAVSHIIRISKLPNLCIEGIFTHFSSSDSKDKTSANKQFNRFVSFITNLEMHNIIIPIRHCANSAGIIDMHGAEINGSQYKNQCRAGIALYGLYPSEDVNRTVVKLKPVMRLKSHIIYIKNVDQGVGISYGSTFITDRVTKLATIPLGYGDGYERNLSNKGYVLIRGQLAPILGRVCMDQFMVDVTDIDGVCMGDEVTLIGKDGDQSITVEELAELAGTFNYEFVCNISKRVPRVYVRNGEIVCSKDYFEDGYECEV